MPSSSSKNVKVQVKEEVVTLAGWPTDVVRVDHNSNAAEHQTIRTILVFIPGNPGCIGWYTKNLLVELVQRLGPGVSARGVSYAGHSPNEALTQVLLAEEVEEKEVEDGKEQNYEQHYSSGGDTSIPWTVNGQIQHKIAFLDFILSEEEQENDKNTTATATQFIFLSHSIGSHMVERLCILRPDLLKRTIGIVHCMPFIRMQALHKWSEQSVLDWAASHPSTVIRGGQSLSRAFQWLPQSVVKQAASSSRIMDNVQDRELALGLLRQPTFARNFFELGLEEIRDVPETIDVSQVKSIETAIAL
jgi:hypothetical protein